MFLVGVSVTILIPYTKFRYSSRNNEIGLSGETALFFSKISNVSKRCSLIYAARSQCEVIPSLFCFLVFRGSATLTSLILKFLFMVEVIDVVLSKDCIFINSLR